MNASKYAIEVSAETTYVEAQSEPNAGRYLFAYTITIANTGATAAQLLTRHWLITDANGRVQEVRGEGVVGEQPVIAPGHSFQYTSAAVLQTPLGSMAGSYHMRGADGEEFDAPIPIFRLSVPRTLH